jgi:hypothetical protein
MRFHMLCVLQTLLSASKSSRIEPPPSPTSALLHGLAILPPALANSVSQDLFKPRMSRRRGRHTKEKGEEEEGGGGEEEEVVSHARRVAIGQWSVVHAFPARVALMQGCLGLLSAAPVLPALSRRLKVRWHVRHVPPARTQKKQPPPLAHRAALDTTPPSLG